MNNSRLLFFSDIEKTPAHSRDFSRELAGQLLINIFISYMANPHKYINLTVCMERFRTLYFPFIFLWAFYYISRCGRVPTPFVVCDSQNPGPAPHDHTGSAVWNSCFSSASCHSAALSKIERIFDFSCKYNYHMLWFMYGERYLFYKWKQINVW